MSLPPANKQAGGVVSPISTVYRSRVDFLRSSIKLLPDSLGQRGGCTPQDTTQSGNTRTCCILLLYVKFSYI